MGSGLSTAPPPIDQPARQPKRGRPKKKQEQIWCKCHEHDLQGPSSTTGARHSGMRRSVWLEPREGTGKPPFVKDANPAGAPELLVDYPIIQ